MIRSRANQVLMPSLPRRRRILELGPLGYIVYLLESLLRNVHFTANIVHGMGCFDPHVLLSLPLNQVTFCFNSLYNSFRVRGWVDEASKSECRDEYFEFVDYLRSAYSSMKNSPGTIPDMLDFLVPMPAFQSRSRLFHSIYSGSVVSASLRTIVTFQLSSSRM